MTYIKSDIDNKFYLVRDLPDKQLACNLLASFKKNIIILINYLRENKNDKYKDYKDNIERLEDRIYEVNISENPNKNKDTSYSINKGEELVLCLRSKNHPDSFHDTNLIFYVVLHEISHIASPFYELDFKGHGPQFKRVFAFLTTVAIELNLYSKIDFNKKSEEYCGMYITDSII
jgi:predicted metal-dependent hydrolase